MYGYETKRIKPNYMPESRARNEKAKLGRKERNRIKTWKQERGFTWEIECIWTIK